MSRTPVFVLTLAAMVAFAANSLLCRLALREAHIDAASFTFVRILSGAVVLWVVLQSRRRPDVAAADHQSVEGNWLSALALFAYAAGFSFAYLSLSAGTGALLLFAAVQATMILGAWRNGERLRIPQMAGLAVAFTGLVVLVFPGISAPPLLGAVLMLAAGAAWGIYSLRGKRSRDATGATAGNFLRAVPFALLLGLGALPWLHLDGAGIAYAVASGAIASGLGYTIWYTALPGLQATTAATVQLSVPVLAAVAGIVLLGEPLTLRFVCAAIAVLGGIALVVAKRRQ